MGDDQRHGRIFGLLFIATFITSIPALALYQPVLDDPVGYISAAGHDTQILFAALLELLLIIANIGTAVVLFPVIKRQSEGLALGYVTARLFECTFILVGIVAVLGIVNTLVLSVVERTRELGLMRAVGATRRQVRTVVRRESVLMALLGAVTGVVLGSLAGVALSRSLADSGITAVTVPVGTLVAYLVVAALVGVLAAVGPARRASRIDVLHAITVE